MTEAEETDTVTRETRCQAVVEPEGRNTSQRKELGMIKRGIDGRWDLEKIEE
jgi:hypothetical protein